MCDVKGWTIWLRGEGLAGRVKDGPFDYSILNLYFLNSNWLNYTCKGWNIFYKNVLDVYFVFIKMCVVHWPHWPFSNNAAGRLVPSRKCDTRVGTYHWILAHSVQDWSWQLREDYMGKYSHRLVQQFIFGRLCCVKLCNVLNVMYDEFFYVLIVNTVQYCVVLCFSVLIYILCFSIVK